MCQIKAEKKKQKKIWQSFWLAVFPKFRCRSRLRSPIAASCSWLQQFLSLSHVPNCATNSCGGGASKNVPTTTWEWKLQPCHCQCVCRRVCVCVCECQPRCHLWFMQRVQCKKSTRRRHKAHNLCRSHCWCLLCGTLTGGDWGWPGWPGRPEWPRQLKALRNCQQTRHDTRHEAQIRLIDWFLLAIWESKHISWFPLLADNGQRPFLCRSKVEYARRVGRVGK